MYHFDFNFVWLYLIDTAISVCEGSFSWERESAPLLKKYVATK